MNYWSSLSLAIVVGLTVHSTSALAATQCAAPGDNSSPSGSWSGAKLNVVEGFESGTLDQSYPSGFSWDTSRRMSIDNGGIAGSQALKFNYPSGENGFSEQRFSLDKAYPDLWIGYWLRVPDNWEHGGWGSAGNNNKFFAIWMDQYEREGPTGVLSFRGSNGDSVIYAIPEDRYTVHPGEMRGSTLARSPEDQGRWMQVVVHAKMASGPTNKDGVFELYRRWEGEQEYEVLFRMTDWENYHIGGNKGFTRGYLMGWANANQPEPTEWLLDDFVVSDQSLIKPASSPAPETKPTIPAFILP